MSELSIDNLKIEDDLEKAINSADSSNSKVFKVKQCLRDLVINELMINKFKDLISNPNNNNNQKED